MKIKSASLLLCAFALANCGVSSDFTKPTSTHNPNITESEKQLIELAEQLKIQERSIMDVTETAFKICEQDGTASDTCKWQFTNMAIINYEAISTTLSAFEIFFPMEKDVIDYNYDYMSDVCDPLYSVDIESITDDSVDRAVTCIYIVDILSADMAEFLNTNVTLIP